MKPEEVTSYLDQNHRAILVTYRRDGSLQTSPVAVIPDGDGYAIISTRSSTAKAKNLARDPRATLCVFPDGFGGKWIHLDGTTEVHRLPEAMPRLADFYSRRAGEETGNDAFRERMESEGRVLLRIKIDRVVSPTGR